MTDIIRRKSPFTDKILPFIGKYEINLLFSSEFWHHKQKTEKQYQIQALP
jgi:hypothetical protein